MRILLVEDGSKLAEPLIALLERERYDIRWARDLNSA